MKNKTTALKILQDYGMIFISCFLYAFTFNCFFDVNNLAMGGFTGIAQVLNRFIPALPVGITVFIMNVPLMVIGVKKQGWKLLLASVFAIFVSSLMIDTMNMLITFPKTEPLLASLYSGVLLGISLGLMMLKSATTGGHGAGSTIAQICISQSVHRKTVPCHRHGGDLHLRPDLPKPSLEARSVF